MTKKAYVIERLPVGMELSDGDQATLYGWADVSLEGLEDEEGDDE